MTFNFKDSCFAYFSFDKFSYTFYCVNLSYNYDNTKTMKISEFIFLFLSIFIFLSFISILFFIEKLLQIYWNVFKIVLSNGEMSNYRNNFASHRLSIDLNLYVELVYYSHLYLHYL